MRHALENRHAITQYGDGPVTLLFVHGLAANQSVWRYVAPAFADRCRIVLMDLVGCGASDDSTWNARDYETLEGHANDLMAVAEHLSDTQTVLVVHSVACMVGLLADLKAPHLFDAHVMVAPSPCYQNLPGYRGGFDADKIDDLLRLLDEDPRSWAEMMAPVFSGQPADAQLTRELIGMVTRCRPAPLRSFARATLRSDFRDRLHALAKPVQVLQGAHDDVVPSDVGRLMQRTMRDCRLDLLHTTGHFPQLTSPQRCIALMDRFLAGLGLGSLSRWPPLVPR